MTEVKRKAQVADSKEWIAEALFRLLEERPFPEITISQVTELSGLSRRTYYRHFASLEDVVAYRLGRLAGGVVEALGAVRPSSYGQAVELFFLYWGRHLDLLRLLQKRGLLHLMIDTIFEMLPHAFGLEISEEHQEYAYRFAASSMFGLLQTWLENGAKETPHEMAQVGAEIAHHLATVA